MLTDGQFEFVAVQIAKHVCVLLQTSGRFVQHDSHV
jgi:hypothetical protein